MFVDVYKVGLNTVIHSAAFVHKLQLLQPICTVVDYNNLHTVFPSQIVIRLQLDMRLEYHNTSEYDVRMPLLTPTNLL